MLTIHLGIMAIRKALHRTKNLSPVCLRVPRLILEPDPVQIDERSSRDNIPHAAPTVSPDVQREPSTAEHHQQPEQAPDSELRREFEKQHRRAERFKRYYLDAEEEVGVLKGRTHELEREIHLWVTERDKAVAHIRLLEHKLHAANLAIQESNDTVQTLSGKLKDVEGQHASLRDSLQLADSQEPRQVVAAFQSLKRSIANVCSSISASITDVIRRDAPNLTLSTHARYRDRLDPLLAECRGLIASPSGEGRPIEDFLDYSLRVLFNGALIEEVLGRFHPDATDEGAVLVRELYNEVRRSGEHMH